MLESISLSSPRTLYEANVECPTDAANGLSGKRVHTHRLVMRPVIISYAVWYDPSMMTHVTTPSPPTNPATATLSMDEVVSILVQHGYRLTKPRLAVAGAVLRYTQPFSAEQLVADLGSGSEPIGRATVYRTLEILAAVDVLTRLIQPDGHPAYICDSTGHRHHIVCSQCGTAVAFTACPLEELVPALVRDTSFQIHDHLLEVFGVCPSCQDVPAVAAHP